MHRISSPWPEEAVAAVAVQNELRAKVRLEDDFDVIRTIAGVACSYNIQTNISRAVIVVMDYKTMEIETSVIAHAPTTCPYIPGFLSFREIPVIQQALETLKEKPDLLMVDGQGVAHPRRLGIAAHLGVLTDIPAIGVAKSRLTGRYEEPGPHKGDTSLLMDKMERIGTVLRSKDKTNPLFISPGHRVSHETALSITLRCLMKYRLPEPTRMADKISKL
jgi:deoxyribonuclease V